MDLNDDLLELITDRKQDDEKSIELEVETTNVNYWLIGAVLLVLFFIAIGFAYELIFM